MSAPTILNIQTNKDPLIADDFDKASVFNVGKGPTIHIHLQQKRKSKVTLIQGLDLDQAKEILSPLKKLLCCNGAILEDSTLGMVLQLTGDQRKKVAEYLFSVKSYNKKDIKIHGY